MTPQHKMPGIGDFSEQGVGGFVVARVEFFERVAGVAPDVEAHGVDLLSELG